jgi:hypothetical protein
MEVSDHSKPWPYYPWEKEYLVSNGYKAIQAQRLVCTRLQKVIKVPVSARNEVPVAQLLASDPDSQMFHITDC